ncbi:M3 family metallopeptidase [Demequina zhanjiangensis]|uniref:M3 family metallopeptidase n=1 Tax=Demequina zhanjiangensis TaxID=3051659 RepID=A0ABT8G152_9MICO|nr:M3 family metallopeptidase [Demequina sp. SYSU T00b26]MDN4472444.1 M3 family metallopeptidase [Demequina sp. SYSU T00b26]
MTDAFLTMPTLDAEWPAFLDTHLGARLAAARDTITALRSADTSDARAWIERWNEGDIALADVLELSSVISEAHGSADVRAHADALSTEARTFALSRFQDADVYASLSALDTATLTPEAAEVARRLGGDFRAQGAHLDQDTRATLAEIDARLTALSVEFSEHIRDAVGDIRIAPERLSGLPQDYIDAHPVAEDGLVRITTEYPDMLPFLDMADDRDARIALTIADRNRAYPENEPVLREMLELRDRKARLLGFPDFPTYATDAMMMSDGNGIDSFLAQVATAALPAGERDAARLLELARRDHPELEAITAADSRYYTEKLKAEEHGVDSKEVRRYLRYEKVRDGVLDLMGHLFGVEFAPVDAVSWHPDVEAYDVIDDGTTIGRIRLDMHPRDGKFGHAACFGVVPGIAGRQLPESTLLCNFSRGLLTHDELETFLHEFGHLVHAIFGGHHPYVRTAGFGDRWEWDFIEAPSQLLEEWAWDATVLQRFATDDDGQPIPTALVDAMRAARDTCMGLLTCRQLVYGNLSFRLHRDHPEDIDALYDAIERELDVREPIPGTHDWASFGHLTDYSSNYYTYQWSLSICRDLFTAFDPDDLLDPAPARRYRERILAPGGTRPAAELCEDFLGRPYSTRAYEDWLASL